MTVAGCQEECQDVILVGSSLPLSRSKHRQPREFATVKHETWTATEAAEKTFIVAVSTLKIFESYSSNPAVFSTQQS